MSLFIVSGDGRHTRRRIKYKNVGKGYLRSGTNQY